MEAASAAAPGSSERTDERRERFHFTKPMPRDDTTATTAARKLDFLKHFFSSKNEIRVHAKSSSNRMGLDWRSRLNTSIACLSNRTHASIDRRRRRRQT